LIGGQMNWSSPTAHDGRRPGADVLSTQGGNLNRDAALWTTPQTHDSAGGNPDRIRRKGTIHGCANLADDVCGWDGAA